MGGGAAVITPAGCLLVRPGGFQRNVNQTHLITANLVTFAHVQPQVTLKVFSALPTGVTTLQTGVTERLDAGVFLELAYSGVAPFQGAYAVTAGELDVFSAQSLPSSELSARLQGVMLRQLAYDGGFFVAPDGGCLEFEPVTFDTRATATACEFATSCGAAGTAACDPATRTCFRPPCTHGATDGGLLCSEQLGGSSAWYVQCDFSTPCPSGFTCVPKTPGYGLCRRAGVLPVGATTCDQTDVSDSCEPGAWCMGLPSSGITMPRVCARTCDEYAPACPGGEKCVFHTCMAQPFADPAVLGAPCSLGHPGWVCGGTATTFLGRCSSHGVDGGSTSGSLSQLATVCQPRCRTDQDCAGARRCVADFVGPTGLKVCF